VPMPPTERWWWGECRCRGNPSSPYHFLFLIRFIFDTCKKKLKKKIEKKLKIIFKKILKNLKT